MIRRLLALFYFIPLASLATVTPLPGSTPQHAPQNQWFEPVRLLVADAAGNPVPGARVHWWLNGLAPVLEDTSACMYDAGLNCVVSADAQGVAALPRMRAYPPATYLVPVWAGDNREYGQATIELIVDPVAPPPIANVQDMWWSGPTENGWGMSIAQHGNNLFSVVYAYDAAGNPTWWALPSGQWQSGFGSIFSGAIYAPTSAPFFAYDVARFQPGAPVGDLSISFPGLTAGVSAHIGPSVVNKAIMRQDFSSSAPSPITGVGDMWWGGPEQNGWGVAIMEQPGGLFAVWLTYGDDGKPTWFVMPGGTWTDARTYSGAMYKTHGSNWTYLYDASQLRITDTGSFTLHFVDDQQATLDYSIQGHSGALALQRQSF